MEIWKDIKDYKGIYQVSNLGNVRSLDRLVTFKDGRKRFYKGEIKPLILNKQRGYLYISFKLKGFTKTISVHTLVYKAFKNYDKSLVIDHIDNNRLNNRLENLQQITMRENLTKDKKTPNYCYRKEMKKYMAYMWVNGKNNHIGYFKTEKETKKAILEFKNKINE
jgi:hypothetical protein